MELKLKEDLQETYIFVPFINNNVIGKFIEEGLYPHLYDLYPELFDVIESTKEKKTKVVNDISIHDSINEGGTDFSGTHTV
jgi:hypothetical protein